MRQMKRSTGIIIILIMVILLAGLGFLSTAVLKEDGITFKSENSYTSVGEDWDLKKGLDLAGGLSITYEVVGDTPSDEQLSDTVYKLQQRVASDLGDENSSDEAYVYPVGDRRISVEIPGVKDADALLEDLGNPGQLYFIAESDEDGTKNYERDATTGETRLNFTIEELQAKGAIILTGTDVTSAQAGYQENQTTRASEPVVQVSMNDTAATAFGEATTRAKERSESIGIYYDNAFISVPNVNEPILGGNCVITGMEDYEAAKNLASYIRIGGLDINLEILQYEIVGAQLGSDALSSSLIAGGIGILLVMVFLIAIYLVPGLAASIALLFYTGIMILLLTAFGVTLTLPGIAGIVLSIGMAVDANVIIFSRIREELEVGKSLRAAVQIGFKKAMGAIIDGNVTTLIAAFVLMWLGSGSVQGFALTLAIGVVLSMFTAIVITRLILNAFIAAGLDNPKSYGRAIRVPKINFVSKKAIAFTLSLIVIVAGFIGMGVNAGMGKDALDFSMDFKGGNSTTVAFDKDFTIEELESEVVPVVSQVTGDNDIQTQKVTGSKDVIIKTRTLTPDEREQLNGLLKENFNVDVDGISSESIGSAISAETSRDALIAVAFAAVFMLVYIWIRFRDIRFGASAIISLVHNLLVVLAIYAIARITVGSAFIACMLTIIGYSINDTIVIFDRIRENIKLTGIKDKESLKELVNKSVNQSIGRSISTSVTTALTVIMILILGSATLRDFALPLLCGIIVGTYSSIFLATNIWYLMRSKSKNLIEKPKKPGKENKPEKATEENQGILV